MKQVGTAEQRDFARSIAGKILRRLPAHISPAEIHHVATIGLWKALQHDREDFTTEQTRAYLFRRIRGSIIDYLRQTDWFTRYSRKHGQRYVMSCSEHDDTSNIPDSANTPEDLLSNKQQVHLAMKRLDPRKRRVVEMMMVDGKQCELAKDMGLSDARISQMYKKALSEMRGYLRDEARKVPSR